MQEKLKAISTKDICVICGEYVPEGSIVCDWCQHEERMKPIRITSEQAEIIIKVYGVKRISEEEVDALRRK
jgi:hypothetical protein